jgi:hypothetical protein
VRGAGRNPRPYRDHNCKLDLTVLNIKHRVSDITLLVHVLILVKFQYCFSVPTLARKFLGSNISLAGFSMGVSFGSDFIQL